MDFVYFRNDSDSIKQIFQELKLDTVATDEDIAVVQEVAAIVSERGAYIVAAGKPMFPMVPMV